MNEIKTPKQRVPIRSWAGRIDAKALKILARLAQSHRLREPVAVMPDVHAASNVCVGTVLASDDVVFPTAIGEDLGCGMASCCYAFEARSLSRRDLERVVERILDRVPVGRRSHPHAQDVPEELLQGELSTRALSHQREWLGRRHLGTLGGGNHFIELQADAPGRLWVTVHSGSRGIGAMIAAHHARAAIPENPLPFLEIGSAPATAFLSDLKWALTFAAANRLAMHSRVKETLEALTGGLLQCVESFDIAHNTITLESFGAGKPLMIHRKGAMPAFNGSRGIIPGSMATASYIVEGRGCAEAYASCSHGAGRKLSRSEAHATISLAQLRRQMKDVVYPRDERTERSLIEEAPGAYKDIKTVLAEQEDLATPLLRLEPLAVVKG
ncbi:MAG TPA: RtcB family protein [Planctomycetota bacterium]|nr:RtcB family protein [Planctomycetota bacterium]